MIPFAAKISNEDTATKPALEFPGQITVVDDERQVRDACNYLAQQPVIGFDTETRPSFRPGVFYRVALLQLSSDDHVFLFRLNKIPFDKDIIKLLENRDIAKIGLAVRDDLRGLREIRHFKEHNFIDLQQLAPEYGIEEKSLRKISAIVLDQRISKAQRLSNWEAAQLTDKQQLYAATDAWACNQIYHKLVRK